jgi:gluconokinase
MNEGQVDPSVSVILMGVTGAGKSTVMAPLAERLDAVSADGDSFHSAASVQKMRAGVPLDDDDRWPWLRSIAAWIGARERESVDAVVTCSALRRRYRDALRDGHPSVRFVHLIVPTTVLERRVAARTGHFMPSSLLLSQLETLEPLGADEPGFPVVADRTPTELADEIAERLVRASGRNS